MKNYIYLIALASIVFFPTETFAINSDKDTVDFRGKMRPWEKGAWETGKYRNVFLEAGYKQEDIDAKLAKAYHDIFEGQNRVYFEVGDSMAYVSDVKNHDARTEGLSYGMTVAVQLDKKDVFDRLWRWTKITMQHQDGPRDAYFAWSVKPETGKHNSEGSASDGEWILLQIYYLLPIVGETNRESTITPKPEEYLMLCGARMERGE